MTSGERLEPGPDAKDLGVTVDPPDDSGVALAEAAEKAAAAVEAQAAAARAHADRLRRQVEARATGGRAPRRARLRRPTNKAVTFAAAIILICTSLALTGLLVWGDHVAGQKRQRSAEFAAAARQDVMNLMSLDFNKTKEDMQRISDNSTGSLKQHFPLVALQLTNGLQRSKVVTTVTVNDVAVESMTGNSAVVLVAATTQAKAPDDAAPNGQQQRQTWRIVLTLLRDNGQPKMSNVEFVQ
jgi:Mce-associated membrane protein